MRKPCTLPAQTGDTRYVYGACTWHGPIGTAGRRRDDTPCCPHCGGPLQEDGSTADFWERVRESESDWPGYGAMLRWSEGRCFPDFDTMVNAYRQAMEGQE